MEADRSLRNEKYINLNKMDSENEEEETKQKYSGGVIFHLTYKVRREKGCLKDFWIKHLREQS